MTSHMLRETLEIADRVAIALDAPLPDLPAPPGALYTVARGSSDHAATVVHRLVARAGIPATTLPPSLVDASMRFADTCVLSISQSGASPDLSTAATHCRRAGCDVIALVNTRDSALSAAASVELSQHAGEERAVAATKSVVCSILAGARLAERWGAPGLDVAALPADIRTAQAESIDELVPLFAADGPLLVIGRGSGLGVAQEIALKVQELLGRPAMAYSSAEVLHGPAGMIVPGYPVLALAMGPEAADVGATVERLHALGSEVTAIDAAPRDDAFAATVALCRVYLALESACRARGRSPDKPDNLDKVTLTR